MYTVPPEHTFEALGLDKLDQTLVKPNLHGCHNVFRKT